MLQVADRDMFKQQIYYGVAPHSKSNFHRAVPKLFICGSIWNINALLKLFPGSICSVTTVFFLLPVLLTVCDNDSDGTIHNLAEIVKKVRLYPHPSELFSQTPDFHLVLGREQ